MGLTGRAGLKMMILSTNLDPCPSHKAKGEEGVHLLLLHGDPLLGLHSSRRET